MHILRVVPVSHLEVKVIEQGVRRRQLVDQLFRVVCDATSIEVLQKQGLSVHQDVLRQRVQLRFDHTVGRLVQEGKLHDAETCCDEKNWSYQLEEEGAPPTEHHGAPLEAEGEDVDAARAQAERVSDSIVVQSLLETDALELVS